MVVRRVDQVKSINAIPAIDFAIAVYVHSLFLTA